METEQPVSFCFSHGVKTMVIRSRKSWSNPFLYKSKHSNITDTLTEYLIKHKGTIYNLSGCKLSGVRIKYYSLSNSLFTSADLSNSTLKDIDLKGCDLSYSKLRNSDLRNSTLFGANLYGSDLRGANLYNADLTCAILYNSRLKNAILSWPSFSILSEILRQHSNKENEKLEIAGMIVVDPYYLWEDFEVYLNSKPEHLRNWVFETLSKWAWKDDAHIPQQVLDWMIISQVSRPKRPNTK